MPFHAKAESAIVLLLDGPENYQKISVVYPRKNPGSYKTGPSPIGERRFQRGELKENSIG